ncbi:hypothetical protein TrCOL_g8697 [Triparma columacea]|uniref:Sugar phosphate transporter domain-containing protein n=1 Tax=Triparma columacea TaxID=722753 RepID=A0A9W7GFX4_9STRA|nr:hypothetical protein TrCOL_g8697 [Triparma columacea]
MKSAIKSAINSVSSGGAQAPPTFLSKVKVPSLFLLWYMLNVYYNIVNKKVLNVVPAPITISAVQLLIGSIYWSLTVLVGLKPKPKLPCPVHRDGLNIGAAAFSHSCGQTLTVVSLGAGAVSFTHIVKALEPFFSAMVSIFFTKKVMHPNVYLSLIPVVGGVGLACLKELSYSHVAFFAALGSNLFFAVRAVKSKQVMQSEKLDATITPSNLFGIQTCLATVVGLLFALTMEGFKAVSIVSSSDNSRLLMRAIFLSGLFHYLNNEVMYMTLGQVDAVTLAVGNTMKRVFIIVASVIVFGNQVSTESAIGSAVGIGGVLLYSLTKMKYEKLEKK